MRIPYCVPSWGLKEHFDIISCIVGGRLISGKSIDRLCSRLTQMTGKKYAFTFNSGKESIQAALAAAGVGAGDEVILPSFCCDTVAAAVTAVDAMPVFCDIGADLNPSIPDILNLLGEHVKAVIYTHLFGRPGAIDQLEKGLLQKGYHKKILIIDDAAQSFGARLNGRLIGTFGDAGIVSLGPGKTMTATGGGVLLTDSEPLAAKLGKMDKRPLDWKSKLIRVLYWVIFRRWRSFSGRFYPMFQFLFAHGSFFNSEPKSMCNIDATMALSQLDKLEDMVHIRRRRALRLDEMRDRLCPSAFLDLQASMGDGRGFNVYSKYPLVIANSKKAAAIKSSYVRLVASKGVEVQPLYTPIHIKASIRVADDRLPMTESLWNRILQIPIEPAIDERTFTSLTEHVARFFRLIGPKNDCETDGLYENRGIHR